MQSELSDDCLKFLTKIKTHRDKATFEQLTIGQRTQAKCQSFMEMLQLKRKNKIDISKLNIILAILMMF